MLGMTLWKTLLTAFAAILLPACDAFNIDRLKPGVSTAAEVRERMGTPGMEWRNDDGGVTWEYSRQPNGSQCFMLTIGADGILRGIEQVLRDDNLARVAAGMSHDQVRRLLGKPRSTINFSLKNEEVWDWKIGTTLSQADVYFNVHFDAAGKVVATSRSEQTLR